jgi:hypothetical protein
MCLQAETQDRSGEQIGHLGQAFVRGETVRVQGVG